MTSASNGPYTAMGKCISVFVTVRVPDNISQQWAIHSNG